jgi:hypothetical protein
MQSPAKHQRMSWTSEPGYPRPDYLSSSRKRLAPQLIFKGGIFHAWKKRTAVALHRGFFETLPALGEVAASEADIAWFVYDLAHDAERNVFALQKHRVVYTRFHESLEKITRSEPGELTSFVRVLQEKVDEKLDGRNPPDTEVISAPF